MFLAMGIPAVKRTPSKSESEVHSCQSIWVFWCLFPMCIVRTCIAQCVLMEAPGRERAVSKTGLLPPRLRPLLVHGVPVSWAGVAVNLWSQNVKGACGPLSFSFNLAGAYRVHSNAATHYQGDAQSKHSVMKLP